MLWKVGTRYTSARVRALATAVAVAVLSPGSSAWSQSAISYDWGIATVVAPKTVNMDNVRPHSRVEGSKAAWPESKRLKSAYVALKNTPPVPAALQPNLTLIAPPAQAPAAAPGAQAPFNAFEGNQQSRCGGVRPDMALAVGSDAYEHSVIQVNNDCISLFTKEGMRKANYPKTMSDFFGGDAFDPRAFYDWENQRYVIVAASRDGFYWIAVSKTINPGGDYSVYSIVMPSGASNAFPDFPRVGHDKGNIYLAGNKVDKTYSYRYEEWLLLPKAELYAGRPFQYRYVSGISLNGVMLDTSQPAMVAYPGDNPPVPFFVSSRTRKVGGGYHCTDNDPPCRELYVFAVAVDPNGGTVVSGVSVPTTHPYSIPPTVLSKDGHLDTGDTTLSGQVSYVSTSGRAASLFASLTTKDPRSTAAQGVASSLLFKIKPVLRAANRPDCRSPNCMVVASATIADEAMLTYQGMNSTFYATMLPDADDNTLTVFNISGPDYYPSTAYILRTAAGQFLGTGQVVRAGQARFGDRYDWGDYTAVAPRPRLSVSDRQVMWFAGEYSGPERDQSNWRTVIGNTVFPTATQP